MSDKHIDIGAFIPYKLEDIGVIIPHSSLNPRRWEWFWPRYKAITPSEVLENTVVMYHQKESGVLEVPQNVREVEEFGILDCVPTEKFSLTKMTLLGLNHCRARIVARIHNDTGLEEGWAQKIIDVFNKPPHVKIMGNVVALGPPYSRVKDKLGASWQHELLHHGDYHWIAFLCGNMMVANRCVWMGYFPFVAEVTDYESEDFYFTLFARADGIPIEKGCPWQHCSGRGKDEISDGCREKFQLV